MGRLRSTSRIPAAGWTLVFLVLLFFATLVVSAWDMHFHLRPRQASPEDIGAFRLRLVAVAAALCGVVALGFRLRAGARPFIDRLRSWFQVRLWIYCAAAGALLPTLLTAVGWMAADSTAAGAACLSGLLLALTLWMVAVAFLDPGMGGGGALRWLDLALFNVIALVLLSEAVLFAMSRIAPSPLLWNDSSAAAKVEQLRGGDGTEFLRYNSRGYPDEEFQDRGPNDYVVAVVTDSFGVGSVPWRYNFATVAERLLAERLGPRYDRIAVNNYGIIIINMPEYLYLLGAEVLPADPDQVVLCIFVGNDIVGVPPKRSADPFRLQHWLVVQTTRRLARVVSGVESTRWAVGVDSAAGAEPAFLHDPTLEEPYFTEEAFLRVERERLEICNTRSRDNARRFTGFFEALELAREWVGPKLLVAIIPDEFQVNDELYRVLLGPEGDAPARYERDYPQRRIVEWCRERGVRVLDLLPALREAEAGGRTYHLRDTHWNARGNRVAGEALFEALVSPQ